MNLRTVSCQEHRCLIKEFNKSLNSKFKFPEQISKLLSKELKSFYFLHREQGGLD
jgi:hemerythrin